MKKNTMAETQLMSEYSLKILDRVRKKLSLDDQVELAHAVLNMKERFAKLLGNNRSAYNCVSGAYDALVHQDVNIEFAKWAMTVVKAFLDPDEEQNQEIIMEFVAAREAALEE